MAKGLSWKRKLSFALITTLILLGAVEVVLHILLQQVGRATIPNEGIEIHVKGGMAYDADLGWKWRQTPDIYFGINKDGFRHEDVLRKKPTGHWRGFTMGDSQTYSAGVDADETYTAFAEAHMRQVDGGGKRIELLNAGISGYTSLQALRLIEKKLLDWDPDAVVVDCRTYDTIREGPLAAPSTGIATVQKMLFHSRIYYLLHFGIDRLRPIQPRRMHEGSKTRGADLDQFGNHDLIADLGRKYGITVIFVDYPFWDLDKDRIVCFAPPAELPDGALVAQGCVGLQQSNYKPKELFFDNNHLTVLGNQIVGKVLAETILKAGLTTRPN